MACTPLNSIVDPPYPYPTHAHATTAAWFVCTLVFFFLLFPRWLLAAQRLTDAQLLGRIVGHYYLQYALLQGIFSLLPLAVPGLRPFGTATTNPLTRFPLFLMGIYAGLLALRHPHVEAADAAADGAGSSTSRGRQVTVVVVAAEAGAGGSHDHATRAAAVLGEKEQEQEVAAALGKAEGGAGKATRAAAAAASSPEGSTMPWPACFLGCFPLPPSLATSRCGRAVLLPLSTQPPATRQDWARMATRQSAGALLFTLAVAVADSYLSVDTHGRVALRGHVWLQVRWVGGFGSVSVVLA